MSCNPVTGLAYIPIMLSGKAYIDAIRNGAKRGQGMPSFESLSDNQVKALQHYLREQANLEETPTMKASHQENLINGKIRFLQAFSR